jgi:hypothetical protein
MVCGGNSTSEAAMSLKETEAECAAVAVAPRVSLTDIQAAIAGEYYFTGSEAVAALKMPASSPLDVLSIYVLVLKNGFTVIGKSAPASPENFDRELGMKLAYEDAIRQLWPLMGFALRDRLHRDQVSDAEADRAFAARDASA